MYCTQCRGVISDDSKFCKYCGEKIIEKINVELNKNDSNLIYICCKDNSIIITKCPICNLRIDIDNDKIVEYNKEPINNEFTLKEPIKCECGLVSLKIKIPETAKVNNTRNIYQTIETNNKKNIPKCPTCGSTNIGKITKTNKVGSALLFGVFSVGHLSKVYECYGCKYKW